MFVLLRYKTFETLFEGQAAASLPQQCSDTSNIVLKFGHDYCHIIHLPPLSSFEELEDYVEYLGSENSGDSSMVSLSHTYLILIYLIYMCLNVI